MGAILAAVGVGVDVALRPVGAEQHPTARRDAAMLGFPGLDMGDRQQEIGVGRGLSGEVEDHRRGDEVAGRNAVERVVGQIGAADPVDRGIEMRAGMLADGEVAPVPGDTAIVVARDLLTRKRRALAEVRRQHEHRRVFRQGLGQVDHIDRSVGEFAGDSGERFEAGHLTISTSWTKANLS
jgi:hypothetical protein